MLLSEENKYSIMRMLAYKLKYDGSVIGEFRSEKKLVFI